MKQFVYLRLYEELNDFLPVSKRKRRFVHVLNAGSRVGDLLENLGVRPEQVELVLVNGDSVGFSHLLKPRDFVSLYPVFESLDVTELLRLRAEPLRQVRFLVGPSLIRLMRYLCLCGFDVVDAGDWPRERIIRKLKEEREILLTRNPDLARDPGILRAYFVRETTPKRQLMEVMQRFDLLNSAMASGLPSIKVRGSHSGAGKSRRMKRPS